MDKGQRYGFSVAICSIAAAVVLPVLAGPSLETAAICATIVLAGIGGPAVARILANRFPDWSNREDR